MSDSTARANAQFMPDAPPTASPEQLLARLKFDAAYSEWLAAKAAAFDPAADESDIAAEKRSDRLMAAEFALVATPAPLGWAVLMKLEFVEGLIAHEFENGKSTYPLAVLALASVKADMLVIGCKD